MAEANPFATGHDIAAIPNQVPMVAASHVDARRHVDAASECSEIWMPPPGHFRVTAVLECQRIGPSAPSTEKAKVRNDTCRAGTNFLHAWRMCLPHPPHAMPQKGQSKTAVFLSRRGTP